MKAIQIEAYGNPTEVVKVVDLPDVGSPVAGEVVIEVEASPINPQVNGSDGIDAKEENLLRRQSVY